MIKLYHWQKTLYKYMKIKKGDNVAVTKGKYRGKTGKVLLVSIADQKVLVEGVNIVKRHVKPQRPDQQGEIIEAARPISIANVKLICPDTKKGTRIATKIVDGKKKRVSKKSGKVIA